jgi:RNA polymerase sigma-70 factor (ECF subfamily)
MSDPVERLFVEYLVASARAGSRTALGRLAERFQPRLLGHARRLTGDAEAARDVVQDAWVEIVRSLPRLHDLRAFPAWAFRITSRRAARWVRQQQRSRATTAAAAAQPAEDPLNTSERAADAARITRALAKLSADQQAAVALFYLEGMGVAEIAVALEIPVGTVKTRLMLARDKLRRELTIMEATHERTG